MAGLSEDEIRLRAYELWESAGKPAGRAHEFWRRAENELLKETREQGEVPPGMTDNLPV